MIECAEMFHGRAPDTPPSFADVHRKFLSCFKAFRLKCSFQSPAASLVHAHEQPSMLDAVRRRTSNSACGPGHFPPYQDSCKRSHRFYRTAWCGANPQTGHTLHSSMPALDFGLLWQRVQERGGYGEVHILTVGNLSFDEGVIIASPSCCVTGPALRHQMAAVYMCVVCTPAGSADLSDMHLLEASV